MFVGLTFCSFCCTNTHKQRKINPQNQFSYNPHLINTFVKESKAGIFVTDKGALLYEPAEHLSLGHEGVKPLMGAVSALHKA